MQIQLKEAELKTAITDYIERMGVVRPIESMEFNMTRNPVSVSALIEMGEYKREDDSPALVQKAPDTSNVTACASEAKPTAAAAAKKPKAAKGFGPKKADPVKETTPEVETAVEPKAEIEQGVEHGVYPDSEGEAKEVPVVVETETKTEAAVPAKKLGNLFNKAQ
jgi:hypothetical protein